MNPGLWYGVKRGSRFRGKVVRFVTRHRDNTGPCRVCDRLVGSPLPEGFHRTPFQPDALLRHGRQPGFFPAAVDCPEQVELLSADQIVRLEGEVVERLREPLGGPPGRLLLEPHLELAVLREVDPHLDVPAPKADRVARVLDSSPPDVMDVPPLLLEKRVVAVGREEDEEILVPEVLDVRMARPLPSRPRPLGEVDVVALDELLVHPVRVLPPRDVPGHVEEVPPRDVGHRELLDEPLHRQRFAPIPHTSPGTSQRAKGVFTAHPQEAGVTLAASRPAPLGPLLLPPTRGSAALCSGSCNAPIRRSSGART